ncbi:unnamed protein product, partial [Phaeothamnion confervicola]
MIEDSARRTLPLQHGEVRRVHISPHHVFGVDVTRLEDIRCAEAGKVLYASGNMLAVLDVPTMSRRLVFGRDGGGVGCFALHPSREFIAVGEKGFQPAIHAYRYPSFERFAALRGGAERGYASLSFNAAGDKLASVARAPDYMLTVWDWASARVLLHCKAFGQDVARVAFSPDNEGRLATAGSGHIRFWRMASTFTGLKLQGDIGKFGKVDLTDVDAFAFLPDGKVLSTTEGGALLLWDGNFVKLRVVPATGGSAAAAVVASAGGGGSDGAVVVTAGDDGYIRWWPFSAIDGAEVNLDVSMDLEVAPLREILVSP